MKTVLSNLIWLALLAVMVAASVYPAFSGVSQAVIWLLNAVIIVFAPLGIIVAFIEGDKEKLANLAGKKTGKIRKTVAAIKFAIMFCAIAYAGFTVAAIVYSFGALLVLLAKDVAQKRLKEME